MAPDFSTSKTSFFSLEAVFLVSLITLSSFIIPKNPAFANFTFKVSEVSQIISSLENFLIAVKFDEYASLTNLLEY